jgi:hypothetical protein
MSVWRGKFDRNSGTIVLDLEAKTGTVDITIDTSSIDVGLENSIHTEEPGSGMFDVAKFPTATYKENLPNSTAGNPTEVQGELTLHGITKPVTLTIRSFKCMPHPMKKKEFCGAMPWAPSTERLWHRLGQDIRIQNGSEARHPGGRRRAELNQTRGTRMRKLVRPGAIAGAR